MIKRLTFADPSSRVTASSTSALLQMEATASAPDAEGVGLVPPLSEATSSFPLLVSNKLGFKHIIQWKREDKSRGFHSFHLLASKKYRANRERERERKNLGFPSSFPLLESKRYRL